MESRRRRRLIVFLPALLIIPSLALHEANDTDLTADPTVCSPQESPAQRESTFGEHRDGGGWDKSTHAQKDKKKINSTKELMNVRVEERFLNDVMKYYHNNSPVFSRCSRCRYSFSFFFVFFFFNNAAPIWAAAPGTN